MDNRKWMMFGLQIGFALFAVTASETFDAPDKPEIVVWLGQEVQLQCGDNSTESTRRSWKCEDKEAMTGTGLITETDHINSINQSSVLRIVNVTHDDEGDYTCTAFTQPQFARTVHLYVVERPCEAPKKPLNGHYASKIKRYLYDAGATIQYYCDKGYELVGEAIRTCSGTPDEWTPEEPYCKPKHMDLLIRRLIDVEFKVSNVENNVGKFESRLSLVESDTSLLRSQNILKPISRERLIACTNDSNSTTDPDVVSRCMTMQLVVRDGRNVSQFRFVVKNFHSKVSMPDLAVVDSQSFYHTVPGYKFKLRMNIRYDQSVYVRLMLLPSDYDGQLTWPIIPKYYMTILKNDGTELFYMKSYSGKQQFCEVYRPQAEATAWCADRNPNLDDVFKNMQHVLQDGSVVVKIYFDH